MQCIGPSDVCYNRGGQTWKPTTVERSRWDQEVLVRTEGVRVDRALTMRRDNVFQLSSQVIISEGQGNSLSHLEASNIANYLIGRSNCTPYRPWTRRSAPSLRSFHLGSSGSRCYSSRHAKSQVSEVIRGRDQIDVARELGFLVLKLELAIWSWGNYIWSHVNLHVNGTPPCSPNYLGWELNRRAKKTRKSYFVLTASPKRLRPCWAKIKRVDIASENNNCEACIQC